MVLHKVSLRNIDFYELKDLSAHPSEFTEEENGDPKELRHLPKIIRV